MFKNPISGESDEILVSKARKLFEFAITRLDKLQSACGQLFGADNLCRSDGGNDTESYCATHRLFPEMYRLEL